jgi:integrase
MKQYFQTQGFAALSEKTQELYQYASGNFFRYLGTLGIEDVTTAEEVMSHHAGFVQWLEDSGKSGATIRLYCQVVRIAMSALDMPVPKFTYKLKEAQRRGANKKQQERWLSAETVNACLNYRWDRNHIRNHAIVRLLAETGLRVQELADLRMDNINLVQRYAQINKSKTTVRTVRFGPDTAEALKAHMQEMGLTLVSHPEDKLFPIDIVTIKQMVKTMLQNLGIKKGADGKACHIFRHWVATNLYYNGKMALEDVAKLLGDNPKTIFSTYLHPTSEMMGQRVDKAMGW